MTAINFPDTPTVGQTFTVGDITWQWDGSVWKSATATGQSLPLAHAESHEDGGSDEVTIAQSQVTNLLNDLGAKAAANHTHSQSDITSLTTDLAAKAPLASPKFTGTVLGSPDVPDTNSNTAKNFGYIGLPQVIASTGSLTLDRTHAGKHIYVTGDSQTVTIPANSSVPFEIGTTIVIITFDNCFIDINSDTLWTAGTQVTGGRGLAPRGMATLVKIAATTWIISGNGLT